MKQLLPIFDSGHGNIIFDTVSNKYIYSTGNKKLYKYSDNETAFEGVINDNLKRLIIRNLERICYPYIDINHSNLDISLKNRINYANELVSDYANFYDCLYVSLHSNAGKGTGIEIYTTIGQSKSDNYASDLDAVLSGAFPDIVFRRDFSDGDSDKESDFYVLKYSKCPAILLELLFFDNYSDFEKLKDDSFIQQVANEISGWILSYNDLKNNNLGI